MGVDAQVSCGLANIAAITSGPPVAARADDGATRLQQMIRLFISSSLGLMDSASGSENPLSDPSFPPSHGARARPPRRVRPPRPRVRSTQLRSAGEAAHRIRARLPRQAPLPRAPQPQRLPLLIFPPRTGLLLVSTPASSRGLGPHLDPQLRPRPPIVCPGHAAGHPRQRLHPPLPICGISAVVGIDHHLGRASASSIILRD